MEPSLNDSSHLAIVSDEKTPAASLGEDLAEEDNSITADPTTTPQKNGTRRRLKIILVVPSTHSICRVVWLRRMGPVLIQKQTRRCWWMV